MNFNSCANMAGFCMDSYIYELQDVKYYPVLVTHNGFTFDFLILLTEMHRRNIPFNRLASINLHFADTFYDCKRQVKCGNPIFTNWTSIEKKCLGISNLYKKYFLKLHMTPTEPWKMLEQWNNCSPQFRWFLCCHL